MKILLKGYYGFGNLGDDILALVTFKLTKQIFPDSEISLFSNFNQNLSSFSQNDKYNHYLFQILGQSVTLIDWTTKEQYDLIIHGGGGVFFDKNNGSMYRNPLNTILKYLGSKRVSRLDYFTRTSILKPWKVKGQKELGIGIGLGEYTKSSSLLFDHLSQLGRLDLLFLRDNYSFNQVTKFKYKGIKRQFSDLAFLTDFWKDSIKKTTTSNNKKIGIVVMDIGAKTGLLLEKVETFQRTMENLGFQITLFSFDENHDKQCIHKLGDRLNIWKPNKLSLANYLQMIADCGVIITTRAHGAIIGACLNVIPICINVSIKLRMVAEMFPKSSNLIDLNGHTSEWNNLILKIYDEWNNYNRHLIDDVNRNIDLMKVAKKELEIELK